MGQCMTNTGMVTGIRVPVNVFIAMIAMLTRGWLSIVVLSMLAGRIGVGAEENNENEHGRKQRPQRTG
jgi:hypothetical protein